MDPYLSPTLAIETSSTPLPPGFITARAKLRKFLVDSFSLDDLKMIAFDLGVNYQSLPHNTTIELAMSLIQYCEQRSQLPDLIRKIAEERPGVLMSDLLRQIPSEMKRSKVQIVLDCSKHVELSDLILALATRLDLQPNEIELVGAVWGSLKVLVSIPSRSLEVTQYQQVNQDRGQDTKMLVPLDKITLRSVTAFENLTVEEQRSWRKRSESPPWPPVHDISTEENAFIAEPMIRGSVTQIANALGFYWVSSKEAAFVLRNGVFLGLRRGPKWILLVPGMDSLAFKVSLRPETIRIVANSIITQDSLLIDVEIKLEYFFNPFDKSLSLQAEMAKRCRTDQLRFEIVREVVSFTVQRVMSQYPIVGLFGSITWHILEDQILQEISVALKNTYGITLDFDHSVLLRIIPSPSFQEVMERVVIHAASHKQTSEFTSDEIEIVMKNITPIND